MTDIHASLPHMTVMELNTKEHIYLFPCWVYVLRNAATALYVLYSLEYYAYVLRIYTSIWSIVRWSTRLSRDFHTEPTRIGVKTMCVSAGCFVLVRLRGTDDLLFAIDRFMYKFVACHVARMCQACVCSISSHLSSSWICSTGIRNHSRSWQHIGVDVWKAWGRNINVNVSSYEMGEARQTVSC